MNILIDTKAIGLFLILGALALLLLAMAVLKLASWAIGAWERVRGFFRRSP